MFFGFCITSDLCFDPKLPPNSFLKITNIALCNSSQNRTLLFAKKEDKKFLITSLNQHRSQVSVNFCFGERDQIRFVKDGPGQLYLTGLLRKSTRSYRRASLDLRIEDFFKLQQRLKNKARKRSLKCSYTKQSQTIHEILEIDTDLGTEIGHNHEQGPDHLATDQVQVGKTDALEYSVGLLRPKKPKASESFQKYQSVLQSSKRNMGKVHSETRPGSIGPLHVQQQKKLILCLESQQNCRATSQSKQKLKLSKLDALTGYSRPNAKEFASKSKLNSKPMSISKPTLMPNLNANPKESPKKQCTGPIDKTQRNDFNGTGQDSHKQQSVAFELSLKSVADCPSSNVKLRALLELSSKRKDRIKQQHQPIKPGKIGTAKKFHLNSNADYNTRKEVSRQKLPKPSLVRSKRKRFQNKKRKSSKRVKMNVPEVPEQPRLRRSRRLHLRKMRKK